jgi:hypothetical protein
MQARTPRRIPADGFPQPRVTREAGDRLGETLDIPDREQHAGLLVVDYLPCSWNVARDQNPSAGLRSRYTSAWASDAEGMTTMSARLT